jgi:hypothetical protein
MVIAKSYCCFRCKDEFDLKFMKHAFLCLVCEVCYFMDIHYIPVCATTNSVIRLASCVLL